MCLSHGISSDSVRGKVSVRHFIFLVGTWLFTAFPRIHLNALYDAQRGGSAPPRRLLSTDSKAPASACLLEVGSSKPVHLA